MSGRADRWIWRTTIGCVGRLAVIAGTISRLHMHEPLVLHGQLGLPETDLGGHFVQAVVKLTSPHIVPMLGLDPGARALVRQRLLTDDDEPVGLAWAWLQLDIAANTDLASSDLLDESIRVHPASHKKIRLDHASR